MGTGLTCEKNWIHVHVLRFHLEGAILDRQERR